MARITWKDTKTRLTWNNKVTDNTEDSSPDTDLWFVGEKCVQQKRG